MVGTGAYLYGQNCPSSITHSNGAYITPCAGTGTASKAGDACSVIGQIYYNGGNCKIYGSGAGGAGWYPYTNIFQCSN